MNIRIGKISKYISPGLSSCGRCNTTWNFVEPHHTTYREPRIVSQVIDDDCPISSISVGRGCFPLCEKCWKELSVVERIPYYRALVESWKYISSDKYEEVMSQVLDAVARGL